MPLGSADFSTALIKSASPALGRTARCVTGELVQRRYAERGYDLPLAVPDPSLYTVAAYEQGQLAGTVSIRLDSERGLYADDLYPIEVESLRSQGLRLCEFTRLAVDSNNLSRTVLASLFHSAYLYAHRLRNVDAAVIEVNPRHVPFYMRALNFKLFGPERHNDRVDAPAVLLFVHFSQFRDGIAKYAGRPALANTTRTFTLWLSPLDEEGPISVQLVLAATAGHRNRSGSLQRARAASPAWSAATVRLATLQPLQIFLAEHPRPAGRAASCPEYSSTLSSPAPARPAAPAASAARGRPAS